MQVQIATSVLHSTFLCLVPTVIFLTYILDRPPGSFELLTTIGVPLSQTHFSVTMASNAPLSFVLLPPEIVTMIFEVLHNDNYKDILASLLVDKTCNNLATQVLYKDLHLSPTSIQYFTKPAQRRYSGYSRSLTVEVEADNDVGRIRRLRAHVSAMHNLLSFSFSFLRHFYEDDDKVAQPVVELGVLLEALPHSVQYLELYVVHIPNPPKYHHGHLCPILSAILPRLRGLRLESTTICTSLFKSLQENCQHLTDITIQDYRGMTYHNCIDSGPGYSVIDTRNTNQFLAAAQRSVEAGRFPAARSFRFSGIRWRSYFQGLEKFECLYTEDVLNNTTTAYPVQVHRTPQGWWMLYTDTPQKETEYVGDPNELFKVIEGAGQWLVAKHGAHLPPYFKDKTGYQWVGRAKVQVAGKDLPHGPSTAAALLRRREDRAGRKLLQVLPKSGLRVSDCPCYSVPESVDDDEEED